MCCYGEMTFSIQPTKCVDEDILVWKVTKNNPQHNNAVNMAWRSRNYELFPEQESKFV